MVVGEYSQGKMPESSPSEKEEDGSILGGRWHLTGK